MDPQPLPIANKKNSETVSIVAYNGLDGLDEHFDTLQALFSELRKTTVEASMIPDLDLLTFAAGAHQFSVIMLKKTVTQPSSSLAIPESKIATSNEDAAGEDENDSMDFYEEPLVFRPAPVVLEQAPEPESDGAPYPIEKTITKKEFLSMHPKQQYKRWKPAFIAKVSGDDSDSEEDGEDPISPLFKQDFAESSLPSVVFSNNGNLKAVSQTPISGVSQVVTPIPESSSDHSDVAARKYEEVNNLVNWDEADSDYMSADSAPPSTADNESTYGDDESVRSHGVYSVHESEAGSDHEHDIGRGPSPPSPPDPRDDPALKHLLYVAARKFQAQLRAERVERFEAKQARKAARRANRSKKPKRDPADMIITTTTDIPIGLVYLSSSQSFADPLHAGEYSMGAYVDPNYLRYDEELRSALHEVVADAFRDQQCHRLQAIIVDHVDRMDTIFILALAGFRREGIRRRAFYSSIDMEYKDVIYLALLATEWFHDLNNPRSKARLLPSNMWEEIVGRSERECDEATRWEETKRHALKRSSSTETIKCSTTSPSSLSVPTALDLESGAEFGGFASDTSNSTLASDVAKSKKRKHGADGAPSLSSLPKGTHIKLTSHAGPPKDFHCYTSSSDSEPDLVKVDMFPKFPFATAAQASASALSPGHSLITAVSPFVSPGAGPSGLSVDKMRRPSTGSNTSSFTDSGSDWDMIDDAR